MSHATQATILRHGRLAIAAQAKAPMRTLDLARKLNLDDRVARRLIRDLREAGYDISIKRDGRIVKYGIAG